MQVRGEQGLATKGGECAIEAQEDLLRQIIHVFARPGQAHEHAEHPVLVLGDDLLESGAFIQGGRVRPRGVAKVSEKIPETHSAAFSLTPAKRRNTDECV